MNGSLPVHDPFYFPQAQSHSNGSQVFIDQTIPFNPAMVTPYRQIRPVPSSVVRHPSSIPSDSASRPMVSHFPRAQVLPIRRDSLGSPSFTGSPHHPAPVRTFSLPVQSVSPKETVLHTCQWMRDDGTPCGAQITYTTVPQHLRSAHGIKNMARDDPIPCRWSRCRPRGVKDTMNRESLVRHVREKHLFFKRG